MVLRFAFDLGTGSIGMAVSRTGADGSLEPVFAGARIVQARAESRNARAGLRRKQARYRKRRGMRRRAFARLLRKAGLLPPPGLQSDRLFSLDPYVLRARALDHPVSLHVFGRLLMHLHKRRGRLLPGNDRPALAGSLPGRTHGESLAWRHAGPVRGRAMLRNRLDALEPLALPPANRWDTLAEFDRLWRAQQPFHAAALGDDLYRALLSAFLDEGKSGAGQRRPDRRLMPALAALHQCLTALERRFGKPDAVTIEQALAPQPAGRNMPGASLPPWGGEFLRAKRLRPTRYRRLVLALMARQEQVSGGQPCCPYSGQPLKRSQLFTGIHEVDHVVPVSRGGASTMENLVLCLAAANRRKGNRLPREMPATWPRSRRMSERFRTLPGSFEARFADGCATGQQTGRRDAMYRLAEAAQEQIAARWPHSRIEWAAPAAVAALRMALQRESDHPLFAKPLTDNRNHALDAVLALHVATTQSAHVSRILPVLQAATVTHVPDNGGPATRETCYGAARGEAGTPLILSRRPLSLLTRAEAGRIRDAALRRRVLERIATVAPGERVGDALAALSRETGIRRVRVARPSASARPVRGGKAWILPSGNAHLDIVSLPTGEWIACGASHADVAGRDWRPAWEAARIGGKLVMRLRSGDMLEIDGPEGRVCRTVRRLANAKGRLYLAAPEEGGRLASRHSDPDDPFRWELVTADGLRQRNARALHVSAAGEIRPRRSNVTLPDAGSRP